MKITAFVFVAAVLIISQAACTPDVSPDSYSVGSVGQVNRTVRGVIVNVRPVKIGGTQSGVGVSAGVLAGGAAGSEIGGSDTANLIGAIGGAVVGGIAGAAIEESATRQAGVEYVIETTNGALVTIVQGASDKLTVGQDVLVIYGSRARVIAE